MNRLLQINKLYFLDYEDHSCFEKCDICGCSEIKISVKYYPNINFRYYCINDIFEILKNHIQILFKSSLPTEIRMKILNNIIFDGHGYSNDKFYDKYYLFII